MPSVSDEQSEPTPDAVNAVLCIHPEAIDRFRVVLRHLVVGLVDQAVRLQLLSSDPRIEALSLGPVQAIIHEVITWPFTKGRTEQVVDRLSGQPPTTVHAMSGGSYQLAGSIADSYDADLVFQVTSQADCEAIAQWNGPRIGRFLAFSEPLVEVLLRQLNLHSDRVELVRPGVLAAKAISSFANPDRIVTILCRSAMERGCGVEDVIEAAEILGKDGREVMVFLLGRGRRESAVRRMIRQRGLSSNVTLVQPSGDLSQAMHSADIFIQPRALTAFSAAALQALGIGMVVVAAPSSIEDYLRAGETAVLVAGSEAKGGQVNLAAPLARAVAHLMNDRDEARRIAAAGMDYIRENHTMSSMAERTATAYRELVLARATLSLPE